MRANEFIDQGAAGIILYAEDTGRYGLQQRSNEINDPGLWAAWGGGREPGETLEQCARRELAEEGGYTGPIKLKRIGENAKYVTFLGTVPSEFEPHANPEWQDYCWVEAGDWPSPMHPGVAVALKNISLSENFADGKKPGRKGLAKRVGVNCKQPVSKLRSIAANSSGERQRMAHWCANMKSGRSKTNESEEIHNRPKLDNILARCIKLVHEKGVPRNDQYGRVGACIIDHRNRKVYGISTKGADGNVRHAEHMAIKKYLKEYGKIQPGAIIVTTLSPCNRPMHDRHGASCQDLLQQVGIEKVYTGYMDPTQHSDHPFTEEVTKDDHLWQVCKELSDGFVHQH